jgi:hypothetical protein
MSKKNKTPLQQDDIKDKGLSKITLALLTISLAIIYFVFSRFSNGFYMHDEVANFFGIQHFWTEPLSVIGANAKTGYKLFYILPVLGGYAFLQFFNAVVSAVTVLYSYKILEKLRCKQSILIFFLLGLQPLWFMLSFRNYAEMLAAFLLVFAAYQHFNKKYIFAAIVISYVAFTRTELHSISGLYFLWLVFNKKWLPAVFTGVFTFINAMVGFAMTGDILHIVHDIKKFSDSIKGAYPRQGFDHFFLLSSVTFGVVSVVLFFNYIGVSVINKLKIHWILLVPTIVVFLMNCIFNAHFTEIGPGGGSLRYLLPIAPFVSILGIISIDEVTTIKKRYLLLSIFIPLLILIGVFQTYEHNFIKLNEEVRSWTVLLFAIATVVIILLPLKPKHLTIVFSLLAIFVGTSIIDTRQIQPEEQTVKKAAKWFNDQVKISKNPQPGQQVLITENSRLAVGHTLFFFYTGIKESDFKNKPVPLIKEATDTLKVGDVVIWESHYGYRPKLRPTSQPYEFYEKDPRFEKIQYYQSNDRRFTIVFFLKVKD